MSSDWLCDKVERVPPISDAQIAEMRRIVLVLKVPESPFYRYIDGALDIDPRTVSFCGTRSRGVRNSHSTS